MAAFKQNDQVRLIQPVIQGTVLRREIVEDEDMYLVAWVDIATGKQQERLFSEEQLEAAPV